MKQLLTFALLGGLMSAMPMNLRADDTKATAAHMKMHKQFMEMTKSDESCKMMCEEVMDNPKSKKMMTEMMMKDPESMKMMKMK